MEGIAEKFKEAMAMHMTLQEEDKPYLEVGGKFYTGREMAKEINDETEVGMLVMRSVLELATEKLYKIK